MIIWTGWGILVVAFAAVGVLFGGLAMDFFQTDAGWPLAFGALVAAAANFFTAKNLEDKGKLVVDPETGEQILLKKSHTFFFIPMRFWTYAFIGLGALMIFAP